MGALALSPESAAIRRRARQECSVLQSAAAARSSTIGASAALCNQLFNSAGNSALLAGCVITNLPID
jgi:hypothetical protein